jgi:hypothetical protein
VCEHYKKKYEKYKRKYETAKSGLTKEERDVLISLICNEQLKHLLAKNEYESKEYGLLEQLKIKIKTI